jgi:hypothetical protein
MAMGYSKKLQKTVHNNVIENQEAWICPTPACSLRRDSLVQRLLSYADDLQL